MKDLINIVELVILARVLWKMARYMVFGRKKRKKTILGKVCLLVSRRLHNELDSRLREQNKKLAGKQAYENVISLHKRKIN